MFIYHTMGRSVLNRRAQVLLFQHEARNGAADEKLQASESLAFQSGCLFGVNQDGTVIGRKLDVIDTLSDWIESKRFKQEIPRQYAWLGGPP